MSFVNNILFAKEKIKHSIRGALLDDTPPSQKHKGLIPSLGEIKALCERYPISSLLPYESYDPVSELYFNLDTVGFMVIAAPATGLEPKDLNVLNGFLNANHAPEANIQISLISDPNIEPILNAWEQHKKISQVPEHQDIFNVLTKNRVNYLSQAKWDSLFSDQNYLLKNYHLIVSYTQPVPKGTKPVDSHEDEIDRLNRMKNTLLGTLKSTRIPCENLDPENFINVLRPFLEPHSTPLKQTYYDENELLNKQLVDEDSHLLIGSGVSSLTKEDETYSLLSYHVKQFPKRWPGFKNGSLIGSFTNNIHRMTCPFILTMTINCPDQMNTRTLAKTKATRATQMAGSPISKYVSEWKDRASDWDYTTKKMDAGNRLLKAFYQIILLSPEGREQEVEQSLKGIYESIGWTLSKSRYIPLHAFMGALPMGIDQDCQEALKKVNHYRTMLSWNCTNVAPWIAEWKGTKTPMMLFTGRRGQLTYFNPFDNDKGNFNMSCCATSGAGKSFFTQEWIVSCLAAGGRSFVIDAGHSYKNLCKLLNGSYIDFGDSSFDINVNPFSSIRADDIEFLKDQTPLLKLLIGQMASPDVPLIPEEKSVLEKAIVSAWKQYGNEATITRVVEALETNSGQEEERLYANRLALKLFPYTKDGSFGTYFEGKSNIDLNNPFVVLDLDALNKKGDLQSVVLLILMMQITQVMYLSGNKAQPKLCIIDEAWRLLSKGSAGEFIEEGYRVARKHGGSFMTITQKVSDYYKSETATAAFMNSDFVIYLRQKPEELASAIKAGHIDNADGKVDILKSLETVQGKYSELAINSPDGTAVLRFTVDPICEKIYSTKAEEVEFLKQAAANDVPFFEAINQLVANSTRR